MSKFDYMNFSVGGYDTELVAHAGKYTEEQVINLYYCNGESNRFGKGERN